MNVGQMTEYVTAEPERAAETKHEIKRQTTKRWNKT